MDILSIFTDLGSSFGTISGPMNRVFDIKSGHDVSRCRNSIQVICFQINVHRPLRKPRGKICRYKTFCMRIFARRTFLRFRYCSIHVKMHVLLTYSVVKRRVSMGSRNLVPAVSPMSGSPTFDTEKKENRKIERGEFRLYRYVRRTNVSFFDPSPNDQRTEHSCA